MPKRRVAGADVAFDAEVVEIVAAAEHRAHLVLTGQAACDFADLTEEEKELNRASARAIPDKLAAAGLRAVWAASGDEVPLELTAGEVEAMARAEHDRWILHTLDRGYTWGPNRDGTAVPPTHPDLVPYEAIPDHERSSRYPPAVVARLGPGSLDAAAREKDRIRVRDLPATLMRSGIALRRLGDDAPATV